MYLAKSKVFLKIAQSSQIKIRVEVLTVKLQTTPSRYLPALTQ